MDFTEMMRLDAHGVDTFVGTGPDYPWGGLYGGQIVAQGLLACGRTVEGPFLPHSLHAYFIRPGDGSEPIRFEVDRLRNGRSFVTRQVVARQSGGAILTMIASFHVEEAAEEVTVATMPVVPPPEDCEPDGWTDMFERRPVPRGADPARVQAWMRTPRPIGGPGDGPLLHACGLAYMSDDLAVDSVLGLHPRWTPGVLEEGRFMAVSLDHAVWFHRPGRADAWHLQDFASRGLGGARGLATGQLFSEDGAHVATVAQEALVRTRRPDAD